MTHRMREVLHHADRLLPFAKDFELTQRRRQRKAYQCWDTLRLQERAAVG